jgi:F-type H+-transporting ATPase subunit gamma
VANLKEIRRRIGSVKNTQKITRAMKLVSTAKLKRAKDAMNRLKPYAAKNRELLTSLVNQLGGEAAHPLMAARDEVKRIGVFCLSSDRGMCGGFNSGILKKVKAFAAEQNAELVLYPLGRRVCKEAAKSHFTVQQAFDEISPSTTTEKIRAMTDTLVDAFTSGEVDQVVIVFNEFQSAIAQVPIVRPLLPLTADESESGDTAMADLIYEPDREGLLSYLVPRYVEVQVRQVVLESIAGEHAARMNAMSNATDNAGEMIKTLTLQANRARQAAITTELMEIISGAESL